MAVGLPSTLSASPLIYIPPGINKRAHLDVYIVNIVSAAEPESEIPDRQARL